MSESRILDAALKMLPVVGACVTFAWGVWVWKDNADEGRESRRVEATRPFLEMQLKFYTEAAHVAARIAASGDQSTVGRFWELYYGELALVENNEVAAAMKDFGDALTAGKHTELNTLALELTDRMRASLAKSWGTNAWQTH
jgi:hypothetical protein